MEELFSLPYIFHNSSYILTRIKPESVIRLLCANKLSFCHLPSRFSITKEPHCALKAAAHLCQNKSCFHHNANDRFGLNEISGR